MCLCGFDVAHRLLLDLRWDPAVFVWSGSIGTTYLTVFLKQIKEFSVHRLKDAWKSQYFKCM